MKTLPTALATHYAGGTTTLADLLKITRKDGQVFAFTSASTDVTISGQLYTSAQGLDISSLEVTAGLAVDNLELTTLDDGTIFSRVEVLAGVWRNADFIISRYNWANPADGIEVRMVGTVGEVHLKRGSITAELRGLQQYLQQPIGSVTSKTCRARLGDSLCGVVLTGYTVTGSVFSADSQQVFTGESEGEFVLDPATPLLLHFDGSFVDSSATPKTVTANDNAQISALQSKFGGTSAKFDGAGDYLSVGAIADFKALHDGTTDFCIDGWVYWAGGSGAIVSTAATTTGIGFVLWITAVTGRMEARVYCGVSGASKSASSSSGPTLNTWSYFKFNYTAASNSYEFRVNSTSAGSGTMTVAGSWLASLSNPSFGLAVGRYQDAAPGFYLNGYLDELRISTIRRLETTAPSAAFSNLVPGGGLLAFENDYFAEGIVTFTSGVNNGLSQKVKTFASGVFTLALPMLQTIAPGTTFSVVAGCRKRLSDCSTKFNNVINFQGEPHLPGVDVITAPA